MRNMKCLMIGPYPTVHRAKFNYWKFWECVHLIILAVEFCHLTMEEAFSRFPHLPEQILEKLDNVGLTKCRKVSTSWKNMIDQKEVSIRKIQIKTKCSQESVKNILRKKNIVNLTALANRVHEIYRNKYMPPLHFAAQNGHLEAFQLMLENVQHKNTKDS